ncbi:hypothetical protein SESBI_26769 [Sesbania bispinosa]|nr:hypothetical protein SESBI_26769 [Sesbania bispinosa]
MRGKKEGGGERALRPRARGTTIAAGTRTRQREMEARTCWWRSLQEAEEGRTARTTVVGAFCMTMVGVRCGLVGDSAVAMGICTVVREVGRTAWTRRTMVKGKES